jgi:dTDP-4-amino-4,6-dideoxygalactose transaminase
MKTAGELTSADGGTGRREVPFSMPDIGDEEIAAVVETLRSGWLSTGPQTLAFEREFAESIGAGTAIAVSSATAGLHLGLDATSIGPGDEVLIPTLTFTSTAATVVHVGATPRLVDVEPDTLNICVEDAARKCGPRTKAIVPVHFAGHPCRMDAILELAAERKLLVMEDAAHAPAALYRGRRIGTISPLTVFSFYATKNLTTGEGGMITTGDLDLAERLRTRRLHGMTKDSWKRYTAEGSWRYDVSYPGFKYNMTDVAAAMGRVQLRRLPAMQACRRRLVARYRERLQDVDAIELPSCHADVEHAWHLFVVRVRPKMLTIGRDEVIRLLNAAGIGTSVHFIPLHEHSYYRSALGTDAAQLPRASDAAARIISLPLFSRMRIDEVDYVAGVLTEIMRRHRR